MLAPFLTARAKGTQLAFSLLLTATSAYNAQFCIRDAVGDGGGCMAIPEPLAGMLQKFGIELN